VKPPVRVDVPIRIRVDAAALAARQDELDAALADATGRALSTASRVLLAHAGPASLVEVGAPRLTWTGDGLDQVDPATRAATGRRVRRVLGDAAEAAGVRPGRRRVASDAPPPIDDPGRVERDLRGDAKAAAKAVQSISRQVQAGDRTAFRLALGGLRPDGAYPTAVLLQLLRELARRQPDHFRELLRPYLTTAGSTTLRRDPNELVVDVALRDDPATALRGAAEQLAASVAAGDRLRREIDAALPGLDRVEGLLQAVGDRYLDLIAFLQAGVEPTRTDARNRLTSLLAGATRRAGVLVALRGDPRLRKLLPELEADLRDMLRWLAATLDRLREVDTLLAVYRQMFGRAADTQEEVQVLREVRELLLGLLTGNPLPDRNVLAEERRRADQAWADWRGRATDRRITRLRLALTDLRTANRTLQEYDPYYERLPVGEPPIIEPDLRVPFIPWLRETRQVLAGLEGALWARDPRRDLAGLILLEQHLVVTQVRIQLLLLWQGALMLWSNTQRGLGSSTERARWESDVQTLTKELATAYAAPDFQRYEQQYKRWKGTLDWLHGDMQRVHHREAVVGILVDAAAMLAAVGLIKVLGGPGVFSIGRLTLIEAGTFTLASGLGQTLLMEKALDPSRMFNQLFDNVALFGIFKLVGLMSGALARPVARAVIGPGVVGEFIAVVGANTVVGIGLPAVVARVQSGEWPDSILTLVASGILFGAIGTALGTPELLRAIRLEGAEQVARELASLHGAGQELNAAVGGAVRRGSLTPADPARFRQLAVGLGRLARRVWLGLGRLPNGALERLGIRRSQIAAEAPALAKLLQQLEGTPPITIPRHLPAVTELVPAARPSGPGVFEYDPAAVSSRTISQRLRAGGYDVAERGGGVLRLTGIGIHGSGQHLLPAGPQRLALPAPPAPSDAELAVFAAAEPLSPSAVRGAVDPRHDPSQWKALAKAAELDADLVRRTIQAPPGALKAHLDGLVEALRASDFTWDEIQKARTGADTLNVARQEAVRYSPQPGILAAVGPGARQAAEQVLGTPDGRALLAAAPREPARTGAALIAPDQVLPTVLGNLASELRVRGMTEPEISAARRGIEALRLAREAAVVDPAELLFDAAGRQQIAQGVVDGLSSAPPGPAILKLVRRRPDLARKAVAATAQENAGEHLNRLAALATADGWSKADVAELRNVITRLNVFAHEAARAQAEQGRLAQVVSELGAQEAFLTMAGEVFRTFTGQRRVRAVAWLQAPNRAGIETAALESAVLATPHLARLNPIALRELWTRYRAPRSRPLRSRDFAGYVDVLSRHGRGQFGEWTIAFWVSNDYLILKWPDATVTASGTDLWLVPRGGGEILAVDVKELGADLVPAVKALTRNLPRNLTRDVAFWDQLQRQLHGQLPAEMNDAIARARAADAAVGAITRGLSKAQIDTVAVQQRITAALAQPNIRIRRVVLTGGGNVKGVSPELARRGVEPLQPAVDRVVRGRLLEAGRQAETVDVGAEIEGKD
jgi:hypothetical protein